MNRDYHKYPLKINNTPKFTEATKYRMSQWSQYEIKEAIKYLKSLQKVTHIP